MPVTRSRAGVVTSPATVHRSVTETLSRARTLLRTSPSRYGRLAR